ncbi:MAG: hypothetical protein F6K55_19530 [Moorea sp. SIO4A3]|nr:hypothetical protein [Moorena sp. SIO4A3]
MASNPLTVGHAGRVRHHGKRTITVMGENPMSDCIKRRKGLRNVSWLKIII